MSFDGGLEISMKQLHANEEAKEVWFTGRGTEVQEVMVCQGILEHRIQGEDQGRGTGTGEFDSIQLPQCSQKLKQI